MAIAGIASACAAPRVPIGTTVLSPQRYEHAADPDPAVRTHAADELVDDPSPNAATMLVTLEQRDIDAGVRAYAASAIAKRRDPSLDAALAYSANGDPDPSVRAAATRARDALWPWDKSPRTAAGFSLLCPGCGQLYLRNPTTGYAELASTAALVIAGVALISGHTTSLDGTSDSAQVPVGLDLLLTGQNLWFYSIFDAYRHARILRDDAGYRHPITRESLPYLASAPFRPSVLARPWVWGGVPLALAAGLGLSYLIDRDSFTKNPSIFDIRSINILGHSFHSRAAAFATGEAYFAALFDPVGVGEESLFRGFFQTELEESLGTYGGLAAASGLFGAVHVFNFLGPGQDASQALVAVPLIAVLGSSLGLAYIHTGYKLETSVAMHFWYDFLLSTAAFAADPTHQPFVVQYAMPM